MRSLILFMLMASISSFLHAQTEADQQILDMASKIEKNVEEIRGRPFKQPVERGIYNKDQLKEYLLKTFEKELPDDKLRGWEASLKIFSLIPRDMDMKSTLIDFYVSQIGGFYDPETKKLYCISSPLSFLLRIVMAHEIAHALQDQYMNLAEFYKTVDFNDDILAGRSSIIEGEATYVMNLYPSRYPEEVAEDLKDLKAMDLGFFALQQFAALQGAPPYFADTLMFPYQYGEAFVRRLIKDGDLSALDPLYLNPPHSSEQIIHPEKFFDEKDEPVKIVLPDLLVTLGQDYEKIYENSMGEYQVKILLNYTADPILAMRASAGWDGDSYSVFAHKETGEYFMIWALTFDSEKDAKQFMDAENKGFGKKYTAPERTLPAGQNFSGCKLFFGEENRAGLLEQRGKDVIVLDALPSNLGFLKEIRKSVWQFTKEEFDFEALKPLPYSDVE